MGAGLDANSPLAAIGRSVHNTLRGAQLDGGLSREESMLFIILASLAVVSAAAMLFLRSPLKLVLAAFLNIVTVLILFVLLEAPIIALIQFVVMILFFAGTVQLIRGVGPERFYTQRGLSVGQLTGLLLVFLLGAMVLLHMSSLVLELPMASAKIGFGLNIDPNGQTILGLVGLLVLAAFIVFRFLLRANQRSSSS